MSALTLRNFHVILPSLHQFIHTHPCSPTPTSPPKIVNSLLSEVPVELTQRINSFVLHNDRFQHFELLDGRIITLGKERFQAMEPLFRPSLLTRPPPTSINTPPLNGKDLQELLKESVDACDNEWQDAFKKKGTLWVTGGTSLLRGFLGRLQSEVMEIFGGGVSVKVIPDPQYAAWQGWVLMSHTNWIASACVTKEDYDESGPTATQRKCLC